MHRVKKYLPYLVAAFGLFYLFSRPQKAGALVNGVFDGVIAGANQLAIFINTIGV